MAFLYPWGNTQQLNLDWILKKIKELETGGGAGADLEEIANALIALTHRSTTQYQRHDYCFYNGKLYRALVNTTGAFAPGDWREVVLGDDVSVLTRLINALNTDNIDNASNVSGDTASDALNNLLTALGNLDSDDIDNASGVTGAAVTDALNNLNGAINTLSIAITDLVMCEYNNVEFPLNAKRYGNVVFLLASYGTQITLPTSWTQVATLPADYRPTSARFCPIVIIGGVSVMCRIQTTGALEMMASTGSAVWFQGSGIYPL